MALTPDELKAEAMRFLEQWRDGSAWIDAHTSGSTGLPKAVRLSKADMAASARATNAFFGLGSGSDFMLALSPDYIAGKMMCVRAELAGGTLSFAGVSNRLALTRPTDLLAVVPSQVDSLLLQPEASRLVRNLIIGGAPLDARRAERLCLAGFNAFATYGMTETCSHVALRRLSEPLYHAMPGISFDVDEESALRIVAPAFSFGTLQTNDIVRLRDATSFEWIGRRDNIINTGGIKIAAEDIERTIAPFMPDCEYFVTSRPDDKWGMVPVVIAEGRPVIREKILKALADARQTMPHHQIPADAVVVDALERTTSGKIKRYRLN